MNADLVHLITLQAQDLELRRLRAELADAPVRVTKAQTARARAEVHLAETTKSLAKEETLRRSLELDVKDRHGKIARLRKQMESATSAAQITALEHEIAFAQQTIAKLEDDELETTRGAATEALSRTTAHLADERARTAQVTLTHNASITAIEAERAALRTLIAATEPGESALSNYDRIAKAKGTGLSQALDHRCSACQMAIRPQRWNDLTDRDPNGPFANTLFTCETCGRLLFHDPRHDAPVQSPAIDRLTHASTT
jgi:predicted  nucleic acid-binding Zn-ribbon protein